MDIDNIPEQFIGEIYCDLGFMPSPSELRYLYEIQKVIDSDDKSQNNRQRAFDYVKKKSRQLKYLKYLNNYCKYEYK